MIPLHFDGRGISSESSLSRSRGGGDSVEAESVADLQPSPEGAACGDRARSVPKDPTSPLLEDDIHTVKRNPAEQARMDAHNPSDGIYVSSENNAGEIVRSVHRAMLPFPEGSAYNVWGQADAYSPLDGIMATNYAVLGRERPYMGRVGCTLSERSQVLPASMLYSINNYTPNKTPFHDNNIILHPENASELTQRSPSSRKNKPIITAGSRCTKGQKQRIYPDIFVDASGKGIGLTMGSNWLAWSFNRSVPRNSNGSIDISWAELVAVELGIRTAQAMGRKCTTITIFSDNKGVVKAMQTRSWDGDGKERLSQVMQRINDFCNKHHLYPEVMWVPTELNPADGPSRGNFLGLGEKITSAPNLPHKLKYVLEKTSPMKRHSTMSWQGPQDREQGIYIPFKYGESIRYPNDFYRPGTTDKTRTFQTCAVPAILKRWPTSASRSHSRL